MSFYDSASLAFLPSGGAGKDGKAYSIKPVPEYGDELITNGGFDTDSSWTKETGWTISGGTASCDGTQTTNSHLYQNLGDLSNKTIKLTFTISGYSAGQLSTAFFGAAGTQVENVSANGTYTFNIDVQSGHNGNTGFTANSSFIGSVDNVSVKEVVDGDFTFSRGSNLTATRVDSNGLIEKGRENLLTYSNTFSNASWNKSETSVTSGQSGYDSSLDAWSLIPSTTNTNNHRMYKDYSSSGGVFAASIYAKANGYNFLKINNYSAGVVFDISTGNPTSGTIVSESGSPIDSNIISVGNGWYRIDVTKDSPSGNLRTQLFVQIDAANSSFSGDGTSGVLIQDAQLEIGLTATEPIQSGATTGLAGLLEDSPRFDYSGGASCPSLLLEPSRTNLVKYSEYFSGLSLSGNPPIITQNYAVSPEGVQNAVRVQDTDATNFKIIQTQFSITAGSTYTISVYVKKATSPISTYGGFYFDFDGGTRKTSNLIFDEYNGTLVNATGNSITSVIHPVIDEGDYWRFSATATDTGSNSLLRPTLRAGVSANGTSLSLVTKDYTAYGFQCEEGSYPTSYIPNHSGGSVTRNADDCGGAGTSSTFNDTEGVLFIELDTSKNASPAQIAINDGTYDNRIIFEVRPDAAFIKALINSGGSNVYDESVSSAPNTNYKVAIKYSANDIAFFVNGVKETSTTTTTAMPTGLADISFTGKENDGALRFIGNVKQTLVFPTALSNVDCEILTGTSYESFAAMATALNYTTYE